MPLTLPMNCRLELISDTAVAQYRFSPDGLVSVMLGEREGLLCVPLYQYKSLTDDSIEIFNHEGSIAVWSNIQVEADRVHVECTGQAIVFQIESMHRAAHDGPQTLDVPPP